MFTLVLFISFCILAYATIVVMFRLTMLVPAFLIGAYQLLRFWFTGQVPEGHKVHAHYTKYPWMRKLIAFIVVANVLTWCLIGISYLAA